MFRLPHDKAVHGLYASWAAVPILLGLLILGAGGYTAGVTLWSLFFIFVAFEIRQGRLKKGTKSVADVMAGVVGAWPLCASNVLFMALAHGQNPPAGFWFSIVTTAIAAVWFVSNLRWAKA